MRCACGLTHLQVSELTELLELPAGELEDVRTMRMVALLKEETAQAKKEKGEAVADVAHDLGYSSPSSFVYMFRRRLGVPPGTFRNRSQ